MNSNTARGLGAFGAARTVARAAARALVVALAVLALPAASGAQSQPVSGATRRLALDEAIRLAETQSEALAVARAGVLRARGQHLQARSQQLPQLTAQGSYARTLKSQFEAFAAPSEPAGPPPLPHVCAPEIPPDATPEQRSAALAQAITCESGADGIPDFSSVGFGARNQWTLGLNFSQTVFAGGRVLGGIRAAAAGRRAADIELTAQRAQLALDVAQAYYDAALADRLVAIADSTLVQTEEVLRQTRLARQVGNQSEFELLRAQVTRDNARPTAIQARSNRSVAYLRLKQLLNLPLDEDLELTTTIDEPLASPTALLPAGLGTTRSPGSAGARERGTRDSGSGGVVALDTAADNRSVVRQSEENVRAQEGFLRVARAERFPSIALTSQYQRLYFPQSGFPDLGSALQNWTVGASVSFNIFTGGRIRGGELVARADLDEARARLQQVRELAALDARIALNQLAEAEATWAASQGTVEQASRAYRIDQIRYREGISTQTDLAQSRILLEQARANRAQASRDLAVARMRLALLRDLPLQIGGAGQGGSGAGAGAGGGTQTGPGGGAAPQQQRQQPRTQTQAAANASAGSQIGGAP
jgi:outer membrane protein